ncbi:allophanate hydrolase [Roseibacillus persicicus]|uniref:Allophanate hydrolase n=1 Tax=Roseibacillus persicicus TaxID=454148 RepID=A0A918TPB0_9BACT|nr:allophanate hydrolase [Roseibacillus persicicus]GHC57331.1 allophanate hydrolase [Roseibacillus persicicus]
MKTIRDYREAYQEGQSASEVLRPVWEIEAEAVFIRKATWAEVDEQIAALGPPEECPLWGIPFLVKDNIDVAGWETTAACPDYAYVAEEDSAVVALLRKAGAICLGKTNLDQFATGLVGVRTPYGVPKNPFDEGYLPGGSSCGSAVGVALGMAAFSLGTDTAGSGRVPAAFNELVGLKPTRGFLSTRGVVDACKSLDCVSIFANSCGDADEVLRVAAKLDSEEAWSREVPAEWPRIGRQFQFGVPALSQLEFFGWDEAADLFTNAVAELEEMGGTAVEIDLEPFVEAAKLLYEGPWVTERFVAIEEFLKDKPDSVWPVTRGIIAGGEKPLASDFFKASYRLADCKRRADQAMDGLDFVVLPTTPRNFTLEEVEAEPVLRNSQLGTYTNFMNLLDYSALALPAGRYQGRLPWGITLFAQAGLDRGLLELGALYEEHIGRDEAPYFGDDWDEVAVAVCGAHLEGMPLNWQLTERGGRFEFAGKTADCYRMYLIPAGDGLPERPALVRVAEGEGAAIDLEVWSLTKNAFGEFVAGIPAPLGMGKVKLEDGSEVPGFIAEARASIEARDLTEFGGWRGWVASK